MKNLEKRTSIRKYAQREVSNELLHRLLQEAERTQTMGNLQLYSVIVTRSEEQKAALAPAHFNQPMVTGAPVVLTFCADFRRTSRWAEERKAQPGYDNFLSFINAATDALLYCQTFCNLADEEGLGYCYLGTAKADYRGIAVAPTGVPCSHNHLGMARRTASPLRPSALREHHPRRALRGLHARAN